MWNALFGSSPVPSVLGYLLGGLTAVDVFIKSSGVPIDAAGWVQLVMAVVLAALGRSTKQTNVSNAQDPLKTAVTVPPPKSGSTA